MKILVEYLMNNIKKIFAYKVDFIMGFIGLVTINVSSVMILVLITNRFSSIGTWSIWEIIFNYALFLAGLGLHKMFFKNIVDLETHIIKGTFDRYLLRPLSPFFQLVFENLSLSDNTDFILGILGIVISIRNLGCEWDINEGVLLVGLIFNSALVFTLILSVITILSFWIYRVRALLYGTAELQEAVQNYPISIYNKPLKWILTYGLPYAATNFYPSLILLNKAQNKKLVIFLYLIGVDIVLFGIAGIMWKVGIKSYESSGS